MFFKNEKVIDTDVLVLGSGGAGLRAALEARIEQTKCTLCGLCVDACPVPCLVMEQDTCYW